MTFDPNGPSSPDAGIFGLPHGEREARVVLLPVPWEATTSYGGGAADGPRAIREASAQVDLYDLDVERPYLPGIHMLAEEERIVARNGQAKALATPVIARGGAGDDPELLASLARVNELSAEVNAWVESSAKRLLDAGKIVGVVGGDHSVPYGAIAAFGKRGRPFGVLHFDAHSDTRAAYEGFVHSHASIMRNVLDDVAAVSRLVQVGVRDVCEQEMDYCRAQGDRVRVFTDREVSLRTLDGERFTSIARDIVEALPGEVWVSFDIDGLDPRYCPHTGTPVPGGLDYHQAVAILREIVRSKRRIVGFDLDEVAPNPRDPEDAWDGNVGARLLYKLCAFTLASQGEARLIP